MKLSIRICFIEEIQIEECNLWVPKCESESYFSKPSELTVLRPVSYFVSTKQIFLILIFVLNVQLNIN